MKVCLECKHYRGPSEPPGYGSLTVQGATATCAHPEAASRDPVWGRAHCTAERAAARGCGKSGKLWQSAAK